MGLGVYHGGFLLCDECSRLSREMVNAKVFAQRAKNPPIACASCGSPQPAHQMMYSEGRLCTKCLTG